MDVNASSEFLPHPVLKTVEPPQEPYDVINALLDNSIHFSGTRASWFGILYYGLRIGLIVLSACAAAKGLDELAKHAPLFSLIVAIGTAIDTWLQPGVRYKGHYTYNDKFRALKADLCVLQRDDSASIKTITNSWKTLDEEYGKAVLPA